MVVAGDCVYGIGNLGTVEDPVYVPLGTAISAVHDQLRTIDRIRTEIGGDASRLIIPHDPARWPHLRIVTEIDGFRILTLKE